MRELEQALWAGTFGTLHSQVERGYHAARLDLSEAPVGRDSGARRLSSLRFTAESGELAVGFRGEPSQTLKPATIRITQEQLWLRAVEITLADGQVCRLDFEGDLALPQFISAA